MFLHLGTVLARLALADEKKFRNSNTAASNRIGNCTTSGEVAPFVETLIDRNQVEHVEHISETLVMPSRRNLKASISASILIVCTAETAFAGMPSFVLRDVYRLRFQEISFFIFLLAVCAFLFQIAWNYGFAEFKSLPRLNYRRALSLSVLFGLMMLLVLTMISGIREVLTPGAWRKQGSTYRLNDPSMEPVRRRSMEHLRSALMEYARTHEGSFPRHDFVPDIPEKLWESPDHDGSRYLYSGGYSTNDGQAVIAIEPSNFGPRRLVLRGSGVISFEEEDTNPAQTAKTR